jgi:LPS export ABC transporter protein LptC
MPFDVRAPSPRQRARWGLGLALAALLAGLGIQLARSQWQQHLRGLRSAQLDFLPEAAQRIQNFRRVKMEGDRKAWEVAAKEAQYFEEEQQVAVQAPVVNFYLQGDQKGEQTVVSVQGEKGTLYLSGRDMDRAELEGNIEVHFKDYVVKTDRAVYERASDTVVSPAAVTILGNGLSINGGHMTVEMEAQRFHLDGNVQTVLKRGEAAGAGTL